MVPRVSAIALSYPSRSEPLSFSASTRPLSAIDGRAVPLSYMAHGKPLNIPWAQVATYHTFPHKLHWAILDLFRKSMSNTSKWPIADPRYPFWDMSY